MIALLDKELIDFSHRLSRTTIDKRGELYPDVPLSHIISSKTISSLIRYRKEGL
jgi:hypothetical protein